MQVNAMAERSKWWLRRFMERMVLRSPNSLESDTWANYPLSLCPPIMILPIALGLHD